MESRFVGLAASPGVAVGRVRSMQPKEVRVDARLIRKAEIEGEKQRFSNAVQQCVALVLQAAEKAALPQQAELLRAHAEILQDPYLHQLVMQQIEKRKNAGQALMLAVDEILKAFAGLDDGPMRERAADLKDEARRLLWRLQGEETQEEAPPELPVILVAQEMPPSSTAVLDMEKVLGIATEQGGYYGHIAILARSMQLPAVVGVPQLYDAARDGDMLVLNGNTGEAVLNPGSATLKEAWHLQEEHLAQVKQLDALRPLEPETTDGHPVQIVCNIGFENECPVVEKQGATGIGLFRSEYLYLESSALPSEAQQYASYRYIAQQMAGRPVVIRTLDIGADKYPSYLPMRQEENPALGCRGIRYSLENPDVFAAQLRALLRASVFGDVRVMLPMVTGLEEVRLAKRLLAQCRLQLSQEGHAFNANMPLGVMIETPAAVAMAEQLAKEVDFFSIGTNDLTQYILCVDRGNTELQQLYTACHPAVLGAIAKVIRAGHAAGIRVSLCGEMAGQPQLAPLLVGLGLDIFSVNGAAVPQIKKRIRATNYADAQKLAQRALQAQTPREVEELLLQPE